MFPWPLMTPAFTSFLFWTSTPQPQAEDRDRDNCNSSLRSRENRNRDTCNSSLRLLESKSGQFPSLFRLGKIEVGTNATRHYTCWNQSQGNSQASLDLGRSKSGQMQLLMTLVRADSRKFTILFRLVTIEVGTSATPHSTREDRRQEIHNAL